MTTAFSLRGGLNLANRITVLRLVLVPLFVGTLVYWNAERDLRIFAASIFLAACLTDALDGLVSRKFGLASRLGTLIDPLADKFLLASAFFGLAFFDNIPASFRLPPWLAIVVLFRDTLLVGGAVLVHALGGRFEPRTNFLGKLTTFFQMFFVLSVLGRVGFSVREVLMAAVALLTAVSGLVYFRIGAQMFAGPATAGKP